MTTDNVTPGQMREIINRLSWEISNWVEKGTYHQMPPMATAVSALLQLKAAAPPAQPAKGTL